MITSSLRKFPIFPRPFVINDSRRSHVKRKPPPRYGKEGRAFVSRWKGEVLCGDNRKQDQRTHTHARAHTRPHAHTHLFTQQTQKYVFRMIYNPLGFYQKFVYMYLLLCEFAIKRKAVFCANRKSQLGERLNRSWHINLERFRYRLRQYCNEICRPLLSHCKNRIMLRVKLKLCRIRDGYPGAFGAVRAPIHSSETLKV